MANSATPIGPERETPPLGIPPRAIPPTDRVGYQDLIALGKLRPLAWFDVRGFGATGDGNHDDAPAIQRAVDAAEKAGGGTVYLPPGTFEIATDIIIDDDGVWIVGAGRRTTTVNRAGTTGHAFDISGDGCGVVQLGFTRSTGATAGAAINVQAGTTQVRVKAVRVENFFQGVLLTNANNCMIDDFAHRHTEDQTNAAGIEIDGGTEHFLSNIKCSRSGVSTSKGIYIHGGTALAEGIRISNFSCIGGGGLGIQVRGDTNNVKYVHISNGDIAEQSIYGIIVGGVGTAQDVQIVNVAVIGTIGTGDGIFLEDGCVDVSLSNCHSINSSGNGILIRGDHVTVIGCQAREGSADGIKVTGAARWFRLEGNECRGNVQSGIEVLASANTYIFIGYDPTGNTGTNLVDSGGPTKVVDHNLT